MQEAAGCRLRSTPHRGEIMQESATSGTEYHHATAEAIREGLTLYLSIDGEPIADQISESLAEDLMMDDEEHQVGEILAHAEIGRDDIEEMIAGGVSRMAAKAAVRIQRLDPGKLPADCRGTLARLRARAWQKSADEAESTGGGRYPPAPPAQPAGPRRLGRLRGRCAGHRTRGHRDPPRDARLPPLGEEAGQPRADQCRGRLEGHRGRSGRGLRHHVDATTTPHRVQSPVGRFRRTHSTHA